MANFNPSDNQSDILQTVGIQDLMVHLNVRTAGGAWKVVNPDSSITSVVNSIYGCYIVIHGGYTVAC